MFSSRRGCPRIQRYSNPDILFNGKPVGIKDKADGARSINNVLSEVAKYFVHVDLDTDSPSIKPSNEPSSMPSNTPSDTFHPSMGPSQVPSISVSPSDSNRPSNSSSPSRSESESPSMSPSILSSEPSMYPSIDPTSLPSQLPSNAPSHIPSSVHSSTPTTSVCEDNSDFKFWKNPKKQDKQISCKKIKKEKDIKKYCSGRKEVSENCRLACRLCEANEEMDQCTNDRNYTFAIKSGELKSCDWISKSGKEWRLRDYCSEVKNGFRIGEMCKQACNEC